MKTSLLFLIIAPLSFWRGAGGEVLAQNLVPNPSFESFTQCPTNSGQINFASDWINFAITPDYYNSCATNAGFSVPNNFAGYQQAANGNAYSGTHNKELPNINLREYIGIQLSDSLEIGKKYVVSFKASLSLGGIFKANCATNNMGALFTTYLFYYDGNYCDY